MTMKLRKIVVVPSANSLFRYVRPRKKLHSIEIRELVSYVASPPKACNVYGNVGKKSLLGFNRALSTLVSIVHRGRCPGTDCCLNSIISTTFLRAVYITTHVFLATAPLKTAGIVLSYTSGSAVAPSMPSQPMSFRRVFFPGMGTGK